jgi:tRNA(fMet)-specific endonuclease VapC
LAVDKSLLDTDILSEIIRAKNSHVVERARAYVSEQGRFTISTVTVVETIKGFERMKREAEISRFLLKLGAMEVLPLSVEAAVLAGRIYGALERSGLPIGRMDPMIAGIALAHNLELVSGNVSHYERLSPLGFKLRITNWREP